MRTKSSPPLAPHRLSGALWQTLCQAALLPGILASPVVVAADRQSPAASPWSADTYGRLPLVFECNQGQTDRQVLFLSRGEGYSLFLTSTEAVLSLRRPQEPTIRTAFARHSRARQRTDDRNRTATSILRLKLSGADPHPQVEGLDALPGTVSYFLGNDPRRWRTHLATYARVRYKNVYPGIDLVYYGNQRQLEYDWIVTPGADVNRIQLDLQGAHSVSLTPAGDLRLHTDDGDVLEHAPIVYQDIHGQRRRVSARFVLRTIQNQQSTAFHRQPAIETPKSKIGRSRLGFQVAAYDHTRPLIIDPILVYSTYLGGSGFDSGSGIAVDGAGNAYVAGGTSSADFPLQTPLQATNHANTSSGQENIFVFKLNAAGTALDYATYLGGSTEDQALGIAVDSQGNAYVAGLTESKDFPTKNPLDTTLKGGSAGFVTKLNATGTALVYSTYLGGSNGAEITGIAVDSQGDAYVTGGTGSVDFPTKNALQPTNHGNGVPGDGNAFITKIDPTGSALVWSTYLGGSGGDVANAIALDSQDNVYVTGDANSTDFPTHNAFQSIAKGEGDAFVTKITADGSTLVYSTYLGGTKIDHSHAIAVDSQGNAYVVGDTNSLDFPTQNAYQGGNNNPGGVSTGFVTKFSSTGGMVYSTYLGGSGDKVGNGESCDAIAVDSVGNAYITGSSSSSDFPTHNPIQATNGGGNAFVTELNSSGTMLVFSTFLGGSGGDVGLGITVDNSGNIFVTGETRSTDFPTQNPFQPITHTRLAANAFVARIGTAYNWQAVDVTVGSDHQARIPWHFQTGSVSVWSVTAAGTVSSGPVNGPYAGYTPRAVAAGTDGLTRLLWHSASGTAGLWLMNANNTLNKSFSFGPYAGWSAIDVTVGTDNATRLLWTHTDGEAGIWTVNNLGTLLHTTSYGPYPGWTARAIAAGGDGLTRVLLNNTNGTVGLWLLNADNTLNKSLSFGPYAGWSAVDVTVGSNNNTHILLVNADGRMGVWTVNNSGAFVHTASYGPYAGWSATHIAAGSDGLTRVLWFDARGVQALWQLNADDTLNSSFGFGPY